MDYNRAVEYLESLGRFGSKPGLERIKLLTERLGNPQEHLKFVHIAGTNGKGSTSAFISSILRSAGYSAGLYTSPHLLRYNERIRVNDRDITDAELARYTARVKKAIDEMDQEGLEHPTAFEAITAMAFLYYYEKKCDVVVLEVGLGGRLDATNVISNPLVSVITKISLDHTEILGNTIAEIAGEKAGIIKQNGHVVTYPQEEEALRVIEAVCRQKNAAMYIAAPDMFEKTELSPGLLYMKHPRIGDIKTSITGVHQVYNAAVALKTAEVLTDMGFAITDRNIAEGFRTASWPGRFELLSRNPDFYIDGGHNPDGIRSFIETFKKLYPGKKATIIFGVMKDKDYDTMLRELSSITERFIAITPPDNPRALDAESLVKIMSKYCKNVEYSATIEEAIEKSLSSASENDVIAAVGSLFYIGYVRKAFLMSARNDCRK